MVKNKSYKKSLNVVQVAWALVRVVRPVHWVKNFSVFAAIIFTGNLLNPDLFEITIWTFVTFSIAASSTYVFNDIFDAEADRQHPIKRNRPIASGELQLSFAWFVALFLAVLSLGMANALMPPVLFFIILSYLLLQIAYSLFLKNLIIIDILVIASGFIIRVYSGAFVIDAHLSVWFLLCVISIALFLAAGKRRAELGVLTASAGVTRKSLTKYSQPLLDSYVTMFGNAAWMSWSLFTFFESPHTKKPVWVFLAEISKTTTISKLLMITIPVVIYGIMRYMSLIYAGRSEAPEKLLLTDKQLTASAVVWAVLVLFIIYGVTG